MPKRFKWGFYPSPRYLDGSEGAFRPAGVDDTSVLRIPGQGDIGLGGGQPGDVYVTFKVKTEPNFRREGLDLYSEVGFPPPSSPEAYVHTELHQNILGTS
jgi:hypothetical protein